MLLWLKNFVYDFPRRLDRWFSLFDLRGHRIDETKWHRKGFLKDYSKTAFWLPGVVLFFLAYGLPRRFHWQFLLDRGWGLLLVFIAALVLHLVICKKAKGRWLPRLQFLLLVALALGVFFFALVADPQAKQRDAAAYPHIFAWLGVVVLFFAMPINRWAAERWILGWIELDEERKELRATFAGRLAKTELFVQPHSPEPRFSRLVRALSLVPITSPVLLVIAPAIVALVISREWLWPAVAVTLVGSLFVLGAAHYQERLSAVLELGRQVFVRGGPGVVSAIVILLAALRLAGVGYVTTVLDQSSKWVLAGFVVMLYYLFWLYEYWSQRALSEVLLGLLHQPEVGDGAEGDETKYPAQIPYPDALTATSEAGADAQGATDDGGALDRRLQIHGNGRLIAIEETDRSLVPENFQAHPALEVFRRIHRQLACRARQGGDVTWPEADHLGDAVKMLEQRARLYRVVPGLLIAAIVVYFGVGIFTQKQDLAIDARNLQDTTGLFQLEHALDSRAGVPEVYAVAASGGGTRAAVYTYSVLKALRERELLDRVVMVSGVSGGSLGLAYYLANREELLGAEPPSVAQHEAPNDPWSCYRAATKAPYIRAVLAGVGEYRFLKGTRLGQLLTEGFDRQLFTTAGNCKTEPKRTFAKQTDTGFIFNSSVSGAWRPDIAFGKECLEQEGDGIEKRNCGSVAVRGSRLALTNVASFTAEGAASTYGGWNLDFDYALINDPTVRFSQAASVSANFPPIFSNAAILLRQGDEEGPEDARYWVTDGGAVENRGMISLLLALRSEIGTWPTPEEPEPMVCRAEPTERAAEDGTWIKVIVAEAAGGSEGYSEDRGTPTALGASREIADKLIPELARQVDREYCRKTQGKARVKVVYLPMASTLARAFGTHWQLLESTTVSDPDLWYESGVELALSGKEMLDVIDLLFAPSEARSELTFEDPRLVASIKRKLGWGEEAAADWNRQMHGELWSWVSRGADHATKDPYCWLEEGLDYPGGWAGDGPSRSQPDSCAEEVPAAD